MEYCISFILLKGHLSSRKIKVSISRPKYKDIILFLPSLFITEASIYILWSINQFICFEIKKYWRLLYNSPFFLLSAFFVTIPTTFLHFSISQHHISILLGRPFPFELDFHDLSPSTSESPTSTWTTSATPPSTTTTTRTTTTSSESSSDTAPSSSSSWLIIN